MSRERLESFRDAITEGLAGGHEHVSIVVGLDRTRLVWSQAGLEVDTGDGIVVALAPAVVARVMEEALMFAFSTDERTEWVEPKKDGA